MGSERHPLRRSDDGGKAVRPHERQQFGVIGHPEVGGEVHAAI